MDFINELTGKGFDNKFEFRNSVVKFLREVYPKLSVRVDNSTPPEIIYIEEMQCGLTNLHSRFEQTAKTALDLKELVTDHFAGIIAAVEQAETGFEKTWEEAQNLVFPQLMPRRYADELSVVSRAFGKEILIGIVVDDEKSYRYVRTEELEEWNVAKNELYDVAVKNLEIKSSGMALTFIPPPRGFLAAATGDGFDAARIVLPSFRALVKENLGTPFRFGVPNRDFLICWRADEPEEFQAAMLENINKDSQIRPYPLSGIAFEVDDFGEIKQLS